MNKASLLTKHAHHNVPEQQQPQSGKQLKYMQYI